MGMYTEIYTKISFVKDLPAEVVTALQWLEGEFGIDDKPQLPEHPFFKLPRAYLVLRGCSYYHQPRSTCNLWFDDISGSWHLCSRADLKNYDGEIAAFFDWVKPYVDTCGKTFIGYFLYEEDEEPTLVYAGEE